MDKRSILILEFFCLLIVASLGSFSLGVIITMVDFTFQAGLVQMTDWMSTWPPMQSAEAHARDGADDGDDQRDADADGVGDEQVPGHAERRRRRALEHARRPRRQRPDPAIARCWADWPRTTRRGATAPPWATSSCRQTPCCDQTPRPHLCRRSSGSGWGDP